MRGASGEVGVEGMDVGSRLPVRWWPDALGFGVAERSTGNVTGCDPNEKLELSRNSV